MLLRTRYTLRKLDFPPNLFWGGDESSVLAGVLQAPCTSPPQGQFSIAQHDSRFIYLCRDRLGLNKLFYHRDVETGVITVGHYLHEVAEASNDYNHVRSVPAGHYARIDRETGETELSNYWDLSTIAADSDFDVSRFSSDIDRKLSQLFVQLRNRFAGRRFFVCLSGGLDSAIVATYARRYLADVTAVTFSYKSLSDDFKAARSIAGALQIPFRPVVVKRVLQEETLETVLRYCQDWRDFNVHCAWVNFQIAQQLRHDLGNEDGVVLTGDLMNEFVADYSAEEFDGTVYYPLPRAPREKLRRFFIYGLDAGDREIGIFHHRRLTLVQPYSVLAEAYLAVPPELLDSEDGKRELNLALIDNSEVRRHLLEKKTRAQVGSSDGGTLGLFHETGIRQHDLKLRWEELFMPHTREIPLEPSIVSGRYRA